MLNLRCIKKNHILVSLHVEVTADKASTQVQAELSVGARDVSSGPRGPSRCLERAASKSLQ